MKKLITVALLSVSLNALALDKQDRNTYNPHSYGAPTLYYSPEGIRERRELELLKERNAIEREQLDIKKEELEIEREELREEKRYERGVYGGE